MSNFDFEAADVQESQDSQPGSGDGQTAAVSQSAQAQSTVTQTPTVVQSWPERVWQTVTAEVNQPGTFNTTTRMYCAIPGDSFASIATDLWGAGGFGVEYLASANPQHTVDAVFEGGEFIHIP